MTLAAEHHLRALRGGVGDVLLDLRDRGVVDERPEDHTLLGAAAHLQPAHLVGEPRGERVVHGVLHVDAVGAHAGLAVVAVLGGERALDRGIEVGVVEDDERRVAAELARAFPVTTLSTPWGTPARTASSASASAESGVWLAGFKIMVQPEASAGPALRVIIALGKFHGVIAATTPIGCLMTTMRRSGVGVGITSP